MSKQALHSILEQGLASAFSFFLFIILVRILPDSELGAFAGLFSLSQTFIFLLFGLVLLPMSSASGPGTGKQIGQSLTLLIALILAFAIVSPLLMKGLSSLQLWPLAEAIFYSVAFFAAQSWYEAARWMCVRLCGSSAALPISAVRLTLFFGSLYFLPLERWSATSVLWLFVATNTFVALSYAWRFRSFWGEVRPALPNRTLWRNAAILGNGIAAMATNYAVIFLVDRILGGVGLAAFNAIRSFTNPIGLMSQVLDNHYAAYLARSGKSPFAMNRVLAAVFLLMLAASGAIWLLAPYIIVIVFTPDFFMFSDFLPILFIASISHAVTRPILVEWRIHGETRNLHKYSGTIIGFVLPGIVVCGMLELTNAMLLLFALQPLLATIFAKPFNSGLKARV